MTAISPADDGRPGQTAQLAARAKPTVGQAETRSARSWSPAQQGLAALGIYLLVWLLTADQVLIHHMTWAEIDQKSMDPNFYVWSLRWWPYAIGHGLNPLYTNQIGAPAGHSLAWVTTVPPLALLVAPLTLTAGPVVAFNVLTVIALPLSAWAAFVLCRRLTGKFWASLVGGAVFGFSAYEVNHGSAGQLNLVYSLLMPILAYLVLAWWQGSIRSRTLVIFAGLAMAVQFYLFLETFADMTAILAISLVLGFALIGRAGRGRIVKLAKLLGLAYAIAIVAALPYLAYAFSAKPPQLRAVTGLDMVSLVVPRPQRTLGIPWLRHLAWEPVHTSAAGYIGVPLLVLAILLAVTSWQDRLVRFLTCMLAFIIVASFGPYLYVAGKPVARLPWATLWGLPFLRNAYPSRLMLFAFLALAVGTALWLAGPAKRVSPGRVALAVLVLAFIAMDTPTIAIWPNTLPKLISSGAYRQEIKPGEIVVVVSGVGNAGMLWQAETGYYMRIAGGFINAGLSHQTDLPLVVKDLAAGTPLYVADFEKFVKTDHVGAILLDAKNKPPWVRIFGRVGLVGHRVGNVIIYPTDGCQACRALGRGQLKARPA
ncbi:MAG TPA: hypothetical protein VMB74_18400 [Streptosporangiaceae bacterium]|nr:hypothetical protein [Streptosporangiaceae bacterium]